MPHYSKTTKKVGFTQSVWLVLLFSVVLMSASAQNLLSKQFFKKPLALDVNVTLMNKTDQPIEGAIINYMINGDEMPPLTYNGVLHPHTRFSFLLPRSVPNGGIRSFEGSVSSLSGQPPSPSIGREALHSGKIPS